MPTFRRASIMYVPGSDARKLAKASACDTKVFDLEDSVPIARKQDARDNVAKVLAGLEANRTQEACVRVNSVASGFIHEDLKAVLGHPRLDSVLIPKVNGPDDIHLVSAAIDASAANPNLKILATIESAQGLLHLKEIIAADASRLRIEALVFASEDYIADLGLIRTPSRVEMLLARQLVVAHAVANGMQAIDCVCVNFKEVDVLREECREGRTFGFTGKQAIHPSQVDIIQEHFTPTPEDVDWARQIMEGNAKSEAEGKGAFNLKGKMIDAPVVLWAKRILAKVSKN
ncbi:hypothetical protein HDU98_011130 [Podochytrium sp. JEL0797]|nr:hypothetical protein HDU98_011130 [Podochytrium sp. JEL0797]